MTTEQSILEEQRWDPVYKLIQKKSALKPEEDVDIDDVCTNQLKITIKLYFITLDQKLCTHGEDTRVGSWWTWM